MMIKKLLIIPVLLLLVTVSRAQIRIVFLDPVDKAFSLKNFGSTDVDVASLRMCHNFDYPDVSSLDILEGDLVLSENEEVKLSLPTLGSESDLGLYKSSGSFSLAENLLDFVQFGSGGNGREGLANDNGFWSTGDFLTNDAIWEFNGEVNDYGKSFWAMVTAIKPFSKQLDLSIYPNPSGQGEAIAIEQIESTNGLIVKAIDAIGNVYELKTIDHVIDTRSLNKGLYVIEITERTGRRRRARLLIN